MGKTAYVMIDMEAMNRAARYEDEYSQYVRLFQLVATTPESNPVVVSNAPYSWVPLLRYLRCQIDKPIIWFPHDHLLEHIAFTVDPSDRTAIEVLCGFRPETVDALWKCDMQWHSKRPVYQRGAPFVVTNNGSFHRREVTDFMHRLRAAFDPKRKRTHVEQLRTNVVLLPCAADKPFPAAMHQRVLDMLPDGTWHAMIATGVCGLVPSSLWGDMPWYDSGVPNEWRVMNAVRDYFNTFPHRRVVVYCDFYSQAIQAGLMIAGHVRNYQFVLPVQFYYDYEDLHSPERLAQLKRVIETGQLD